MIASPLLMTVPDILHGFGSRDVEARPVRLITSKQVHGTEIGLIDHKVLGEVNGMDALVTRTPGIAVGVKTADCLPILIADPEAGIVAAVHAGWRGTLARIVEKTVSKMIDLGAETIHLSAALGPCHGGRCYEVEEDVAGLFRREFLSWPEILETQSETKWILDVAETNRRQLIEAGLAPERIDRIDLCTHCRPDLFHSYRRDGAAAGRMVNFIQLL